ncbi:hydrogenase-4 component G [Desulfobacter hydrogenophilus]|uniref:Hydrogenase-4 component G n=2 Tax=Desulfobacter hydrogenophilus TaxID=2291 RepID=A0A328FDC6_9BACT|nr:hydrogenase-4 component G [Desulfobacter hydrogenophilus]QBH14366.1 hydrogenase-4 component G [Desulfobacter hydrogenophilus]RAM02309.1 hydrogenase-4 component G [Desulfobacter hydrogenophilus]
MINVPGSTNNFTGIDSTLFQPQHRVGGNKSVSTYSMQTEIVQFSLQVRTETQHNIGTQNAFTNFSLLDQDLKSSLIYNDTPISELSPEQADELVSENGYFGVDKTSQRIADFVIKGAGDDMEKLKSGREGVLKGFKEAEKAWGGKLPEISYETLAKSLETIDEKIQENGGSVVDLSI